MDKMIYVWIAAFVVLVIIEAATVQLVTIWFAAGALAAFIASLLDAQLWQQLLVFIAVSLLALVLTRPLVKKMKAKKFQPTNSDRYLHAKAVVIEEINNTEGKGQVKAEGSIWSARSAGGEIIEKDATVTVEAIEGVKFIVRKTAE